MRLPRVVFVLTLIGVSHLAWTEEARPGLVEKRSLIDPSNAKVWTGIESNIEIADMPDRPGTKAMHWHIPIDYHSGEAAHPVGWPRTNRKVAGAEVDWSGWDFLALTLYTTCSSQSLPSPPAGLGILLPDKQHQFYRPLTELAKDQRVEIRIPVGQLVPSTSVGSIQFSVSEADYRDGESIDFYFEEIALLRYSQPTIVKAAPASSSIFADARVAEIAIQVAGVRAGTQVPIECVLWKDGQRVAATKGEVGSGSNRLAIDLRSQKLEPGSYEMSACLNGSAAGERLPVRVLPSPWP